MLSKLRSSHPFAFAIVAYVIFSLFNMVGVLVGTCIPIGDDRLRYAVILLLGEVVCALGVLLVVRRTGQWGSMFKKGRGLASGLAVGAYDLVLAFLIGGFSIFDALQAGTYVFDFSVASVIYIVYFLVVGFVEEILARYLIARTFLERYGTSRKGVIKATLVSGMLFGLMHAVNITNGSIEGMIVKVLATATGGIFYAAVYFRTGSLLSTSVIHGVHDVMYSATIWLLVETVEETAASTGLSLEAVAFPLIYGLAEVVVSFFLLRPKKAGEVRESWPEIAEDGAKAEAVEQA